MKFFVDTEFAEDGHSISLLSIGVVAEDGREFYRESFWNVLHAPRLANDWVKANVLPHLTPIPDEARGESMFFMDWLKGKRLKTPLRETTEIARDLRAFVGDETPDWWGSCISYDHVAICQLFGPMVAQPAGWPYHANDIQAFAQAMGLPRDWDDAVPKVGTAHNALDDARWTRDAYVYLWHEFSGDPLYLSPLRKEA